MEVPRLRVESKLQLPAYATVTANWGPGCICDLRHSSQQRWIPSPLREARARSHILMDARQVRFHCATMGTPRVFFLTCKLTLVICVWSFGGHSLSTQWDQIPGEGTNGIYRLAHTWLQPHFWPYPVPQTAWIPGSCQNMLCSFTPLGVWSECSLLAWDLFSARKHLFLFQDSDLSSCSLFMPFCPLPPQPVP